MNSSQELRSALMSINHKSYPAYKSLHGKYDFGKYLLSIDHVQGDPFAAPSKVSIQIAGRTAGFPKDLYGTTPTRIALQDHLIRLFSAQIERFNFKAKGSGKSGLISVSRCGQEVLERSACTLCPSDGGLLVRMEIGFPANGRTINSPELIKILFDFLPDCVERSFLYRNLDKKACTAVKELCEDQEYIRGKLPAMGLAAFVANGAILPRLTGVSDKPMRQAVPFSSPASLEVTMDLPNRGPLKGMGIPCGITLVVGGGFHGKSTLLKALELGVYNHIAGDGREFVITDASAVKLRAEDSRNIRKVDISLFINHLPNGKDTKSFSTEDASGSTSQAANVIEGIESGTSLFLIDEDTSATNFMIRDELMQRVVSDREEPITPFICRVRDLYEQSGISSIIVAGSSGSYFHVADTILQMKEYKPYDITEKAKKQAEQFPAIHTEHATYRLPQWKRCPAPGKELKNMDRMKLKVLGREAISLNRSTTDLRYVEQLADSEQLATLAYILRYCAGHLMDGRKNMLQIVDFVEKLMDEKGLAALCESSYLPSNLARPRRQEIFACINRCRDLI